MNMWTRFASAIDDRLNPIVVKEIRQATRSRILATMLFLFMIIALFIYFMVFSDIYGIGMRGQEAFSSFYGLLLITCIFIVPSILAFRFAAERRDDQTDLLYITTISAERIIAGKLFAGMIIVGLFYAVALPFISLTWFLRGIDFPTIIGLLVQSFFLICCVLLSVFAVLSLAKTRPARVLLGALLFFCLMPVYGLNMAWNLNGLGSRGGIDLDWFLIICGVYLFCAGLFFLIAVAGLKPGTHNKLYPIRLYITGGVVVAVILFFVLGLNKDAHEALIIIWTIMALALLLAAISERKDYSHKVRLAIPQGAFKRLLAFPFFTGMTGGLVFTMIHMLALVAYASVHLDKDQIPILLGFFLITSAHGLTAMWLHRFAPPTLKSHTAWFSTFLLMLLAAAFHMIAGIMIDGASRWDESSLLNLLGLFSPFLLTNESFLNVQIYTLFLWSLFMLFLNRSVFIRQIRAFKPIPVRAQHG